MFMYFGLLIPKMMSKIMYCQLFGHYLQIYDKMILNYTLYKIRSLQLQLLHATKKIHFKTVKKALKKYIKSNIKSA